MCFAETAKCSLASSLSRTYTPAGKHANFRSQYLKNLCQIGRPIVRVQEVQEQSVHVLVVFGDHGHLIAVMVEDTLDKMFADLGLVAVLGKRELAVGHTVYV